MRENIRLVTWQVIVAITCLLGLPGQVIAETKVMTTRASYTMGDGETPAFAEAMALQKAKQLALEEASTYVQSYTKSINQDLTIDEIHTIAGGILKTEVLSRTRTLIGEGLRLDVAIKATVTTDELTSLASRIRDKDVVGEYKKLRTEYAALARELETLKHGLATIQQGPEREAALESIQIRQATFQTLQKTEASLFHRIVSGHQLFAKALAQVSKKDQDKATADALFERIREEGFAIQLGEPTVTTRLSHRDQVKISVPVTVALQAVMLTTIKETALSLGGDIGEAEHKEAGKGLMFRMGKDPDVVLGFRRRVNNLAVLLEMPTAGRAIASCYVKMDDLNAWLPLSTVGESASGNVIYSFSYVERSDRDDTKPLGRNEGWVVAFLDSVALTASLQIPLTEAREISAVRGTTVELSTQRSEKPCEVDHGSIRRQAPTAVMQVQSLGGPSAEVIAGSYEDRVLAQIYSLFSPPIAIPDGAMAVVGFRVAKTGVVDAVKLEWSSGNDIYDLAAQRAVYSASPLPAFPSDRTEEALTFLLQFPLNGSSTREPDIHPK